MAAAGMATHLVSVGVKDEWQEATRTKSLPTTMVADSERSGAATVMENHGLRVMV